MSKNFVYFDVEYANNKNKSICQIGMVSETLFLNKSDYETFDILVNPNDEFAQSCVDTHHISADKVKDAKTFDVVWDEIKEYFDGAVVVGHNVCGADLDALCKNLVRYDIPVPKFRYIDTYEIAQRYVEPYEVDNYRLPTLCNFFGIDFDNHHDAHSDAVVCYRLLKEMLQTHKINLNKFVHSFRFDSDYDFLPYLEKTTLIREVNLLIGKINGLLADNVINNEEKEYLKQWRKEHDNFMNIEEGEQILTVIDSILADDVLTIKEANELKNILIRLSQCFLSANETKLIQELHGMVRGISADKELNIKELDSLQNWIYKNSKLTGNYPYDKIKEAVEKVIKDRIITDKEKKYLMKLFDDLFNPVKQLANQAITFGNKEFCLSGDFEHGSKDDVGEYIIGMGGIVHPNVRKSTDYVVVGGLGSAKYSNCSYGKKVKRGLEVGATILTEKQLYGEV